MFKPANPHVFKNVALNFGEDGYEAHVSSAVFTPKSSTASWTGLNGQTHTDDISSENTLDLAVVQDLANEDSLWNYLFDNAGTKVTVELTPPDAPTFTAEVTLVKPTIGGKVNEFNESQVSLPSSEPVKAPAA